MDLLFASEGAFCFCVLRDLKACQCCNLRDKRVWSNNFSRLNGWLRNCFAQLTTPLDSDGVGQKLGREQYSDQRTCCSLQRWHSVFVSSGI